MSKHGSMQNTSWYQRSGLQRIN